MKNILFSIIVLQCFLVVGGFYESSFSNIVGCLERTQVTILMPGIHNHPLFDYLAEEKFHELMRFLSESPHHTPYIFVNILKRSVEWKDMDHNFDYEQKVLSSKDLVTIIEDEIFVKDTSIKQTCFLEMLTKKRF